MKKKTRIDLLKVSLDLTIAMLNKHGGELTDDEVLKSFERAYTAVTSRFTELEGLKNGLISKK
jgi:hypothetical protein